MFIIDFNQVALATMHSELGGRTDVEIQLPLLRHMVINTIRANKVKFGRDYGQMVIACDSKNYWRKDQFPHYKAMRKKGRDASGLDWNAIFEALSVIKAELKENFPYPVIEIPKAEADDIIASLVFWSQENELVGNPNGLFDDYGSPQPVLILSGDHDFQQLQKFKNVRQYAPTQKKFVKCDGTPQEVLMEHIIKGDKGDGVPNFLSPDDTFVSGGRQKPIKEADLAKWRKMKPEEFKASLNEQQAINFDRNKGLVDLTNIPSNIQEAAVASYLEQANKGRGKILNYFIANRMKNMIDVLGDF